MIPRCIYCGEETTPNKDSSFFGKVHRYGPTRHEFKPYKKYRFYISLCHERQELSRRIASLEGKEINT